MVPNSAGYAKWPAKLLNIWLTPVLLSVALLGTAHAGCSTLLWDAPLLNEDGSPYLDPSHYKIYAGCIQPGQYEEQTIDNIPYTITRQLVSALPDGENCYFRATAVNQQGVESAYSNEAIDFIESCELAGPVENLSVTWQESTEPPVMGFTYKPASSGSDHGNSSLASVTITAPSAGDLQVMYVNTNADSALGEPDSDSGAAWSTAFKHDPVGESGRQGLAWRVCNGLESTTPSWSVVTNRWGLIVKTFSSATDAELENAPSANSHGTFDTIMANAVDGKTMADGAVSVIFGGKDWNGTAEAYTTASQSYTGVLGNADNRMTAGAHRIFATGATITGSVDIAPADGADSKVDNVFSIHASFVESEASGVTLVVPDALQSVTADNVALTQSHTLAVAEAIHAPAVDNVPLTQSHTLAVAEALQSHLSDSPTLSQAHLLSVAETLQAVTADNVDLTVGSVLAVAEALMAVAVDGVALNQANVLAVNDALQALASDNLDLSQSVVLILAEALQAVTADNVDLTAGSVLSVAEALQSQTVDAPALTQAHTLAVAEATQAVEVDALTLSTAGVLGVQAALQSVLVDSPALTQAHTLSVAETIQAVTADNVDLSESVTLAVAEALQAVNVDPLTLTPANVLSVANALQAVTAAGVELTQSSSLIVDDALHAMLSDVIVITEGALTRDLYFRVDPHNRVFVVEAKNRFDDTARTLIVSRRT